MWNGATGTWQEFAGLVQKRGGSAAGSGPRVVARCHGRRSGWAGHHHRCILYPEVAGRSDIRNRTGHLALLHPDHRTVRKDLTTRRLRDGRPVRDVPRRAGGQPGTAADFWSRPTKGPLRAWYSGNCGRRCGPGRQRHERRSRLAGTGPGTCEKGLSTPIPCRNIGDRGLRGHDVPPVVTADSTGNGCICQLDSGNISLRLSCDRPTVFGGLSGRRRIRLLNRKWLEQRRSGERRVAQTRAEPGRVGHFLRRLPQGDGISALLLSKG